MDLREITKQTAPIQKSQLGQHPQVKRQKFQRQETDGSEAQSAFQQLDRAKIAPEASLKVSPTMGTLPAASCPARSAARSI